MVYKNPTPKVAGVSLLANQNQKDHVLSQLLALGLHSFYDFTKTEMATFSSGTDVDTLTPVSGTYSEPMTYVSGVRTQITDAGMACNGSQNNYQVGSPGDFDFLHLAAGSSFYSVQNVDSTSSGVPFLFVTNINQGTNPGAELFVDYSNDRHAYRIRGGSITFTISADVNTLLFDRMQILSARTGDAGNPDNIFIDMDGVQAVTSSDSGYTWGTGTSTVSTRFAVSFKGVLGGMLFFTRRHTEAEKNKVNKLLVSYYDILEAERSVFLLIGASNAEGLAAGGGLSPAYQGIIAGSTIFAHKDGDIGSYPDLDLWPHEQTNSHVDQTSSDFGPDLSFMSNLYTIDSEPSILLKSTVSGTDMFTAWNPSVGASATAYEELKARLIELQNSLTSRGYRPIYRACVVGLGENDASASFRYNSYEANMEFLDDGIRAITSDDIQMIHVKCSTEDADDTSGRSDGNMVGQSVVRTAQEDVATADARTVLYQPIDGGITPDYSITYNETTPNGIHFDATTTETIGEDLAVIAASGFLVSPSLDFSRAVNSQYINLV